MIQNKTILSLTIDLLANNAFSHLKDEEISAMHHLILKLQEPLSRIQEKLLLSFWNHACTVNLPPHLLHCCNTLLQHYGRNPLEMQEVEMELY